MKKLTIFALIATLLLSATLMSCNMSGGNLGSNNEEPTKEESPIEGCTGVEFALSDDGQYYFLRRIGKCTQPDIVIPSTYEGLPVVSISNYAFRNCTTLKSIVIPDSVQNIGIEAFSGCTALESVVMEGVVSMDFSAFSGCTSLKSVSIADTIEYMPHNVFEGCTSLVYAESEGGKYLGNSANPYTVLIELVSTDVASFAVNSTTKVIANDVFSDCNVLTNVEIPASVKTIGARAFSNCTNLSTVTFESESQLKWIWEYAFEECKYLSNFKIPSNTLYIGDQAFTGCKSLGSLVIPMSVETVGYYAFSNTMSYSGNNAYRVQIYCEAASCPNGWDSQWNGYYDNDCDVTWGSTGN